MPPEDTRSCAPPLKLSPLSTAPLLTTTVPWSITPRSDPPLKITSEPPARIVMPLTLTPEDTNSVAPEPTVPPLSTTPA
ncbi:hypothetical protein [Acidisoma sp. S159]|uniref:hypothetical protein n=1 Tax=Acidisoma sp. S159 TaxID=1747225 RepID=UPI0015756A7E|nr:hypothetical protein [Acidisoma sp. S159]